MNFRGGFCYLLRLDLGITMPTNRDAESRSDDLLRQARAGDAEARGRLLEAYRNYLALLARAQIGRRLRGKVDASDLVQEAFLKAHQDFAQFQGATEAELAAWLRQILAARLVDLLRRYLGTRRRNVRLERDLAAELDRSSRDLDRGLRTPQASPSEQAAHRERAVLLADALERLPPDYREAIVLRQVEGLSFAEIAQRMGRTLASVEKLWVRGLVRLRRVLGDES
jgi:RNA polymerase sigma-70 factor (ECF subfamily)